MKKILLIGDSIRIGYDKYVKMAFEGAAEVYYTNDNCRFASYVLRHLPDWKKTYCQSENVDLVHWNAGLWDCLRMLDGRQHTDLALYKDYVERVCNVIKKLFPGVKMIFATSTPVQEQLFDKNNMYRLNDDVEAYNAVAVEVIKNHGGEINDLYALMKDKPVEYYSDTTHYYTKIGTQIITDQVIAHIERTLGIKANPLDYDTLFAEKKNIVGI